MKRIAADDPAAAAEAAAALRAGAVVLLPTDTQYALAADALSDEAVERVYALKERDGSKPMHALLPDIGAASEWCNTDARVALLDAAFRPGGRITFVLPKKPGKETGICRAAATFGFRVPESALCLEVIRAFGGPLTATSANASGLPPEQAPDAILEQIGPRAAGIAVIIDAGPLPPRAPSTVVDLTGKEARVLREGAVSAKEIGEVLAAAGGKPVPGSETGH